MPLPPSLLLHACMMVAMAAAVAGLTQCPAGMAQYAPSATRTVYADSTCPMPVRQVVIFFSATSSCAVTYDRRVKCWGSNAFGQLGQGHKNHVGDGPGEMGATLPYTSLGSARTVQQMCTGSAHACVLLDDGSVKCWGKNSFGQLGLGDVATRGDDPNEMGDLLPAVSLGNLGTGVTIEQLDCGAQHTCIRTSEGKVKCWGSNSLGSLGLGLGASTHVGVSASQMGDNLPFVNMGTNRAAKFLSLSLYRTCVWLDNDKIKCWGSNDVGQLGIGSKISGVGIGDAANEMGDNLPYVDLGAGLLPKQMGSGNKHTCVLFTNDRIKCWGSNDAGQLGLGDVNDRGDQPG
jgi:alpha-tubulin suppressor-like RCC1 family protein